MTVSRWGFVVSPPRSKSLGRRSGRWYATGPRRQTAGASYGGGPLPDNIMLVSEVETPSLVVDLDILERNIQSMADHARLNGVGLRPHAKTHKSAEIAAMQLRAGALGLTLAKIGEV